MLEITDEFIYRTINEVKATSNETDLNFFETKNQKKVGIDNYKIIMWLLLKKKSYTRHFFLTIPIRDRKNYRDI